MEEEDKLYMSDDEEEEEGRAPDSRKEEDDNVYMSDTEDEEDDVVRIVDGVWIIEMKKGDIQVSKEEIECLKM